MSKRTYHCAEFRWHGSSGLSVSYFAQITDLQRRWADFGHQGN